MPLITVNIAEGHSEADIRKLMAALHTTAHAVDRRTEAEHST